MTDDRTLSKTLSYWLRHRPDVAGIPLDSAGWTQIGAVLEALERKGLRCDLERLHAIVAGSDKQRFEISPDGQSIRARQGHSIEVELGWPAVEPPQFLYHGTVERFLAAIMAEGLKSMNRHHVHLSPDVETAMKVGARRGRPLVLRVDAAALAATGQSFYLTANGVWLTESVPPSFLERMDTRE